MNKQELRKNAAKLAIDIRAMEKQYPDWTIKDWNEQVRSTVQTFMKGQESWLRANGYWEE
jgi:hypothetical protein